MFIIRGGSKSCLGWIVATMSIFITIGATLLLNEEIQWVTFMGGGMIQLGAYQQHGKIWDKNLDIQNF